MSNPRKRRRIGSDSAQAAVADAGAMRVLQTFERVEPLLCDLLAAARAVADLQAVVGAQRAEFIGALRSLIWVDSKAEGEVEEEEEQEEEEEEGGARATEQRVGAEEREIIAQQGGGEVVEKEDPLERKVVQKSATSLGKRPAAAMSPGSGETAAPPPPPPPPPAPISNLPPTPTWPPKLPHIDNQHLRAAAFTPGSSSHDFQRMEFLGDAYLQAISSQLLYDRFPSSREGALSEMRCKLVSNIPLYEYARVYDFNSRIGGGGGMVTWKNQADAFEAYIAGVALSDPDTGVQRLKEWLAGLFEPVIAQIAVNAAVAEREKAKAKAKARHVVHGGIRRGGSGSGGGIRRVEALRVEARKTKTKSKAQKRAERRVNERALHPPPPPGPSPAAPDSEAEWEEWDEAAMAQVSPPTPTPTPQDAYHGAPVDKSAKEALQRLVGAGGALRYVPLAEDVNGVEVVALLTGWGVCDEPIGHSWGADEEEAGLRVAMSLLSLEKFCVRIRELQWSQRHREELQQQEEDGGTGAGTSTAGPSGTGGDGVQQAKYWWVDMQGAIVIDD